jgi:hypothetical protein
MLRLYRYLIYRLYSWRLQKKDITPVTSTEIMMCISHFFQLMTLYAILVYFFPKLDSSLTKLQVVLIAFAFQFLYHFLVYNKKRWNRYNEEFRDETDLQRKRGTFYIACYIIGSPLLFFASLTILFG